MESKRWIYSKTLWLNAIAMVVTIVQALQGQAWFPVQYQVAVLAVLNAGVRFLTNQPVGK